MEIPKQLYDVLEFINQALHYSLVQINQTPITLVSVFMFCFVVVVFFIGSKLLNRYVIRGLLSQMQVEKGLQYTLLRVSHYVIVIIGALVAFQFVGVDLGGLAVIFGLLSVGIGFGLQNITSNFISGIILLFERPIQVGDRVTVGDTEGDVTAINIRSTTIQTLDNISIIVPNSEFISSNVTNWSHGDPKIRLTVDVGVSYHSDLDAVIQSLQEVAAEHPDVLSQPKPDVLFRGFGDSAWNMTLRAWIRSPKRHHTIRSELNCAIVRRFRERGVEIPFPQQDVHVRSPLPIPHVLDQSA
jgi:small-conductance mechanosensitive channel